MKLGMAFQRFMGKNYSSYDFLFDKEKSTRKPPKAYTPNGTRECARRVRQMERGILKNVTVQKASGETIRI